MCGPTCAGLWGCVPVSLAEFLKTSPQQSVLSLAR